MSLPHYGKSWNYLKISRFVTKTESKSLKWVWSKTFSFEGRKLNVCKWVSKLNSLFKFSSNEIGFVSSLSQPSATDFITFPMAFLSCPLSYLSLETLYPRRECQPLSLAHSRLGIGELLCFWVKHSYFNVSKQKRLKFRSSNLPFCSPSSWENQACVFQKKLS